ncbi:hypothetical protein SteCoe_18822 [Stentor coeruleus]|uniref:Uncharacterized protein n=1 Tax=Stentor coeruleus TaxID=5963 RepID=A0A1R2BVG8_9CILI|nr:hypothetical protein SteCoe_18822 [Stentor coeruleus]
MRVFPDNDHSEDSLSDFVMPGSSSPRSSLAQIYTIIKDLISLKRNFFMVKDYENFLDPNQYQEALQKLEAEVRNHIKIEQQLKLFIESQELKIEEIERTFGREDRESTEEIENLDKENKDLMMKIAKKEAEIVKIRNAQKTSMRGELFLMQQTSIRDAEKILELDKKQKQLTENYTETETNLEKQKLMCFALKKENIKLRGVLGLKSKSSERDRSKSKSKSRLIMDRSKKSLFGCIDGP